MVESRKERSGTKATVVVRTPNILGYKMNMNARKYDQMKKILLSVLHRKKQTLRIAESGLK